MPNPRRNLEEKGSNDLVDLHHLVAVVVDHFDCNAAGFGLGERAADGGVERGPGVLVDVCL
jgi:hypothetical protein